MAKGLQDLAKRPVQQRTNSHPATGILPVRKRQTRACTPDKPFLFADYLEGVRPVNTSAFETSHNTRTSGPELTCGLPDTRA
jgi:hypothetical protein